MIATRGNLVATDHDRRLVMVSISQPLILEMITAGWKARGTLECVAGVPPDANLVNAFIDPERGDAYYVFYHPTFDKVPEGQYMPVLGVTMRIVTEDAGTELT
jgi:hypothetical protein